MNATLYTAAESLRIVTALLSPVLPQSAPKIWAQLGMPEPIESVRFDTLAWGGLQPGQKIGEVAAVFPRIELKEAVANMRELEEKVTAEQSALLGKKPSRGGGARERQDRHRRFRQGGSARRPGALRRAREGLRQADAHEGRYRRGRSRAPSWPASPKPTRPEQLLNRKVVIVANLQPRKLKGIESNGMIVAASVEGGKPVLAGFHEDIPVGARLK